MNEKLAELTVTNYRRRRGWGWGYSFTPTGADAYSIETPAYPDHVGTLKQLERARETDQTWQAHRQSAYYNTAWFYRGRRIVATWGWRWLAAQRDYGYGWITGWAGPDPDQADVIIQVAA